MPLSAVAIKAAKGRAKPYKLTDTGALCLHVNLGRSRSWKMNYHYLCKQKTLSFGVVEYALPSTAESPSECVSPDTACAIVLRL